MFEFQWPWFFLLLPLPVLLRRWLPKAQIHQGKAIMAPFLEEFSGVNQQQTSTLLDKILFGALLCAWILLVTSLAKPVWIGGVEILPQSSRNIILAIDLSGSMEQRDFRLSGARVSRLAATKKVAVDFVKRRRGDRVALILFGDQAYLQVPLTRDLNTVNTLLNEAELGLAGERTALGDAIGLAIKKTHEQLDEDHVLVLMTDGAATTGADVAVATRIAVDAGLKIYTVGIGSISDSVIKRRGDLDEKTLRNVASETGGFYFRARSTEEFEDIYKKLDELEPVADQSEAWRPVKDLFYWPASLAALLLAQVFLLREWRSHRE